MAYTFKIWIDADSCPSPVRNYVIDQAKAKSMNVVFAANHEIPMPKNNPLFTMMVSGKENQAADNLIFENASGNDIVVTRDIPFAARLVERNIFVMNDRGVIFTKNNIKERLAERDFNLNMAQLGLAGGAANRYGPKELKKFADAFERQTSQIILIENCSRK